MSTIQFGLILVYNLCIGNITPPVGNALFVGIKVGRTSLSKVMPYMLMYYVAIIGACCWSPLSRSVYRTAAGNGPDVIETSSFSSPKRRYLLCGGHRLFLSLAQRQSCALYYLQREGDTMRRRTFLAGLGFAALQLAGCAAKPQTTPDYVLTYADNQPAGYPTTQARSILQTLCSSRPGARWSFRSRRTASTARNSRCGNSLPLAA